MRIDLSTLDSGQEVRAKKDAIIVEEKIGIKVLIVLSIKMHI